MEFNLLPNWNGYTRKALPNLYWNNGDDTLQLKIIVKLVDNNNLVIRTFSSILTANNDFIVDKRTGLAAIESKPQILDGEGNIIQNAVEGTPEEFKQGEYDFLISLFGTFENPSVVPLFEIIKQYILRNESRLLPTEYL